MGKMFVGAIWGAVLVLCIWVFASGLVIEESVLPLLAVFGLIGCGIGFVVWILDIVVNNWD